MFTLITYVEAAAVDHPTPAVDSSAPIDEKENIDGGKDEKKDEDKDEGDADHGPNQKDETVDLLAMEPYVNVDMIKSSQGVVGDLGEEEWKVGISHPIGFT